MTTPSRLLATAILTTLSLSAHAGIIVDGNLADWGVHKTGKASDWNPSAGIYSSIEDQHGNFLDPGFGGQAYDAEALYATLDADYLYIALATGHNPYTDNNPSRSSYGAGDFAIDFGKDGSYELGINIKPYWDTFGVSGGVFSVSQWSYGLWDSSPSDPSYKKSEHPTSIAAGTLIGTLSNSELNVNAGGQKGYGQWKDDIHYFYEMRVDLDFLKQGGWKNEAFNIHWTQNCANDSIMVDPPSVPEPGTLAMFGIGMAGMLASRRRSLVSAS